MFDFITDHAIFDSAGNHRFSDYAPAGYGDDVGDRDDCTDCRSRART